MIRKIIQIEEEKCNGCGACADACHEGAIGMVNGKAKLLRDDYCDGLGDCLPACPTGAITFVEREAAAYDEAAVLQNKKREQTHHAAAPGTKCTSLIGIRGYLLNPFRPLVFHSCGNGRARSSWFQSTPLILTVQNFSSLLTAQPMLMPGCMRIL